MITMQFLSAVPKNQSPKMTWTIPPDLELLLPAEFEPRVHLDSFPNEKSVARHTELMSARQDTRATGLSGLPHSSMAPPLQ